MAEPPSRRPSPARVLGLYALSVMEREDHLYGYELAERISERTGGSWKPGPGAVYPALSSLVRRGLARPSAEGRRRVYRITPEGRELLQGVRRGMLWRARGGPDIGIIWSEIAGRDDPGTFMVERLETQLVRVTEYLSNTPNSRSKVDALRRRVLQQLRLTDLRISGGRTTRSALRGRRRKVAACSEP